MKKERKHSSGGRAVLFYKPYGVLSQFTSSDGHPSLSGFGLPKGVYPAGRLDLDSEGLLLLTDDGQFQRRLTDPRFEHPRDYWVQVENIPSEESLKRLSQGVLLKDGLTKPAVVRAIPEPHLPPRNPPIRFRRAIPTAWLEIILKEGRNHQVRRMTASVGHPTLRLVRARIGRYHLTGLLPGQWKFAKIELYGP